MALGDGPYMGPMRRWPASVVSMTASKTLELSGFLRNRVRSEDGRVEFLLALGLVAGRAGGVVGEGARDVAGR